MLLFFVLFIFFILHIQFLLQNIFLGLDEQTFFGFTIKYGYDHGIAIQSLLFSLACALCFSVGYILFYRKQRRRVTEDIKCDVNFQFRRGELLLANIMGTSMIVYMIVVIAMGDFDYSGMVAIRESNGFIFELRMIYLLLLSHILLNIRLKQLIELRELKATRLIVIIYFICTLFFQARSAVFEVVAIFMFTQLMWKRDKIKLRYIFIVAVMLLVPNIIVMGRLGIPDSPMALINGLFSFEYSIEINNFLSAAIVAGSDILHGISFMPSLELLIPSPLRDYFGLEVVKSGYYSILSADADVSGGGFSLLAEMFSNFGWMSLLVFWLLGVFFGYFNSRAAKVGNVVITSAVAPLLYGSFILAFRNDFGVFLKYSIQLIVISWILRLLFSGGVLARRVKGP